MKRFSSAESFKSFNLLTAATLQIQKCRLEADFVLTVTAYILMDVPSLH